MGPTHIDRVWVLLMTLIFMMAPVGTTGVIYGYVVQLLGLVHLGHRCQIASKKF